MREKRDRKERTREKKREKKREKREKKRERERKREREKREKEREKGHGGSNAMDTTNTHPTQSTLWAHTLASGAHSGNTHFTGGGHNTCYSYFCPYFCH